MFGKWEEIDRFLTARGVRIGKGSTPQTTGGGHTPTSHHYIGAARDYGKHDSDAEAVARRLELIALQPNSPIAELFCAVGNTSIFIKNGQSLSPVTPKLRADHRDHCHVALKFGRTLF